MNKTNISVTLVTILLILTSFGCCCNPIGKIEHIPVTDLVFQVDTLNFSEELTYKLGFINTDGSNEAYMYLPIRNHWCGLSPPVLPIVSRDSSTLVFRIGIHGPFSAAPIVISRLGNIPIRCDFDWGVYRGEFTNNQSSILVDLASSLGRLMEISLLDCNKSISEGLIKYNYSSLVDLQIKIGSLSPNGGYLVFSSYNDEVRASFIYLLDLTAGEYLLIDEGDFPTWSPNGSWIAYTGLDGIYITSINAPHEIQRITEYTCPDLGVSEAYHCIWPPMPSWSPDGYWLTYHKCLLPPEEGLYCQSRMDYSIFTINVLTQLEEMIYQGGLNPYWRK